MTAAKEPRETCSVCEDGGVVRFDPNKRGHTCGGLELVGWLACDACGTYTLCPARSKPADAVDWSLAKGGRSVNAGGIRIRAETGPAAGETTALMARIVRLPELEREVERLRSALDELLGLANVPERDQDEAWQDAYARIASVLHPPGAAEAQERQ